MKLKLLIVLLLLVDLNANISGQVVFRFEHIGTEQGLSQNTGSSILFDSKGFMWIGTMNGLNRYDGYEFRIYKGQTENSSIFTNNRVTKIWEDRKGFIWIETYDGYYHFFNPRSEIFSTVPDYKNNVAFNIKINSFFQYTNDIIFLGSSNAGIFMLQYEENKDTYRISQYLDKGNHTLSNNQVRFIHADKNRDVWIGTNKGINLLRASDIEKHKPGFQQQFVNISFTSVCEGDQFIWFGSEENGIYTYNCRNKQFGFITAHNQKELPSDQIFSLFHASTGDNIVGFKGGKVMLADQAGKRWISLPFHGKALTGVFEDRYKQAWMTALEFGVTRIDLKTFKGEYYILTPEVAKHLTDLERPQFYEDHRNNLWIGLHGGGLALYNRNKNQFQFFTNDPNNPYSISSNIIHSIAEDKNGQLWLGTGQFLGGIEKVILENQAFEHYLLENGRYDLLDNIARAIMEDQTQHLWVATKAGRIHIFDSTLRKVASFDSLPGIGRESVRNNTYSLLNDHNGYIWIGTKGDGLSVSTQPLNSRTDYRRLRFKRYRYSSEDSTTLGNNNIYSICEDKSGNIWVGTYGNGISLIKRGMQPAKFIRITQQNSNLSNNQVRNLMVDSYGNLWVATVLGLNLLEKSNIDQGKYHFRTFFRYPSDKNSLSYNDVVHIFEDTKKRIWLGTFGGGVDMMQRQGRKFTFTHYTAENGLGNDVIFGILEDNEGYLWFSSENGLIRLHPDKGGISLYNTRNGLYFNNFSENTCFSRKNHTLCFGGYMGIEMVEPDKLVPEKTKPQIELSKFLLFNKEVPVAESGSPLSKNISFTDKITLRYNQSSFSLNFSALEFLDPAKISYAYKLDGFDEDWNYVGNQAKATYTNLSPGRYVFRVKSLRSNDLSGSSERVLKIRIRPPWWKTIFAYLAYLVLIFLIAYSIFKTVRRLNRYRNELLVEKKVNEMKLKFFTNISHEIRTPLTLIIGPIEDILASSGISQRDRTLMGIIHKNARRMLHLTSQLLDFRKIQNNKMVLKISEIEIISFTRDIFENFVPLARHKNIRYTFHTDAEGLKIFGDPSKIDTIIYNIISNAIKYTEPGKRVGIDISGTGNDSYVDISVRDEGPGIPQKNLSEIFTRYTILSNQDLAGTGIGLSLAYELARLHQGDILISSVEGHGSTFTIRLLKGREHFGESPLIIPGDNNSMLSKNREDSMNEAEDNEASQEEASVETVIQGKKDVVLIVEDNLEILNYISQALHSAFTCIGAKNGDEGLHIARQMNPDIIITDIMMPGMDGIEMTRMLKEDFNTCHIPVVMLTSKVGIHDQIEGIETGAEAYILKPFNLNYLKAVTRNLLNQRQKVLTHIMQQKGLSGEPLKVASRDEEFLKNAIKFVEENYQIEFSIDDLAKSCCVGRTIFYNKIKGLTGLAPLEFVRKIKLRIAAQLLEKGFNVTEVAYKTGFSDVKYFSKQFKIMYGFSPSKQKEANK